MNARVVEIHGVNQVPDCRISVGPGLIVDGVVVCDLHVLRPRDDIHGRNHDEDKDGDAGGHLLMQLPVPKVDGRAAYGHVVPSHWTRPFFVVLRPLGPPRSGFEAHGVKQTRLTGTLWPARADPEQNAQDTPEPEAHQIEHGGEHPQPERHHRQQQEEDKDQEAEVFPDSNHAVARVAQRRHDPVAYPLLAIGVAAELVRKVRGLSA